MFKTNKKIRASGLRNEYYVTLVSEKQDEVISKRIDMYFHLPGSVFDLCCNQSRNLLSGKN